MRKPSVLFWVVGVFALLWGGYGVTDYVMTVTENEAYLAQYDQKMIDWMKAFPLWRYAVWTVGVFAGLFAAILLLMRRKLAAPMFLLSVVMMVLGVGVHDLLLANGADMYGQGGLIVSGVILVVQILLWLYAARAAKAGVLR